MSKKTILLKLTGEILVDKDKNLDSTRTKNIAQQIKELAHSYFFGIVIGGGNFFRGKKQGKELGISSSVGHQVGMLATMMNGLIVKDLFEQEGLVSSLFCAIPSAEVGIPISQQTIDTAIKRESIPIFTGGTGNPFFTTDTTAVLRGLQMNANQVWKGTHVDGIYSKDPKTHIDAQFIPKITYQEALNSNLGIMDATAFALAKEYYLTIRVFNIFEKDALIKATKNPDFGSIIE